MTCPICSNVLPPEVTGESLVFPFCSKRCKQIDLYRWIRGDYAIVDDLTPEKLLESFSEEELPPELLE